HFVAQTPIAADVSFRESNIAGSPGLWCLPTSAAERRAIVFLHGGGYTLGSSAAYRGFASQLAARARAGVFLLDYPLSPETKLPVAMNLAVDTLRRIQERFPVIAIAGDSAGGGLTLAALAQAQTRKIPVAAAAVFSPWTDLSLQGQSAHDLAVSDPLLD